MKGFFIDSSTKDRYSEDEINLNKNMKKLVFYTLDLNDWFAGGRKRQRFLECLKEAVTTNAFFFLKNHQISDKLLDDLQRSMKEFFDLSVGRRGRYEFPETGRQNGYTPFGIEKGDGAKQVDNKHFFQTGDLHEFLFVKEVPAFRRHYVEYFDAMRKLYRILLQATGLLLKGDAEYLLTKEGNNTLRLIDYPKRNIVIRDESTEILKGANAAGFCAAKHYDINVYTLLARVEEGLELIQNGVFTPVPVKPDCILVNSGMMLEHMTNGWIKAGAHQVVCPANVRRLAQPFFGHVMPRAFIDPLPKINGRRNFKKYPFHFSHDYLMDVLVKIKLIETPVPILESAGGRVIVEKGDTCPGAIYRQVA